MTIERAGALALILGTVAMLGVMALHPSGVPHDADAGRVMLLGIVVHGVAIAVAPVLTFGMFALSRSIGFANPAASLAFFFYLFGAITVMLAATMSVLVAPRLIQSLTAATGADKDLLHGLLRLEWLTEPAEPERIERIRQQVAAHYGPAAKLEHLVYHPDETLHPEWCKSVPSPEADHQRDVLRIDSWIAFRKYLETGNLLIH